MHNQRFDELMKRFGAMRLTRYSAVRGLVAGAAAVLARTALASEATDAADRRRRKRTICHCPDTNPQNCTTLRLRRKRAKKHLQQHPNDYQGKCQTNPAPTCMAEQCAAIGQVCCTTGKKAGTCKPSLNAC